MRLRNRGVLAAAVPVGAVMALLALLSVLQLPMRQMLAARQTAQRQAPQPAPQPAPPQPQPPHQRWSRLRRLQ